MPFEVRLLSSNGGTAVSKVNFINSVSLPLICTLLASLIEYNLKTKSSRSLSSLTVVAIFNMA